MGSVQVIVSGEVHGVFFRQSTKELAQKLGLVGWVKNTADGTVEIMAGGEKNKLDQLIAWCRKGPPFAKVEKVKVEWKKNLEDFEDFSIY